MSLVLQDISFNSPERRKESSAETDDSFSFKLTEVAQGAAHNVTIKPVVQQTFEQFVQE
jgi:hypothetical protein